MLSPSCLTTRPVLVNSLASTTSLGAFKEREKIAMLHLRSIRVFLATVMGSLLGIAAMAPTAQAAVIVSIQQVGADVVATASGSINAASSGTIGFVGDFVTPTSAVLTFGPSVVVPATTSYNLSGPSSFGGGSITFATSSIGNSIGFSGASGFFILPTAYIQGSALSATDTFAAQTLASLGITTGIYNYTVGSGGSTDTLRIFAGVPVTVAVPEPATIVLGAVALPALGMFVWKKRKTAD